MRTIMTAALQWQHLQRELIFWITLVYGYVRIAHSSILTVCDNAGRIKERAWYEEEEFVYQEYHSLSEWTVPKMYDVGLLHVYCNINK